MAEAVGACALVVVALLATRRRRPDPLWSVKPVAFTITPAVDIDPVRDRIRRVGDRLPIRRHDGSDTVYDQDDDVRALVPPPRPLPEPAPEPEPEPDPTPSTEDDVARALDAIQARLHLALDAQYVAFCAVLQVPVAVPSTAKRKASKGKRKDHGRTAQEVGLRDVHRSGGNHRGRRRRRGGVRV